MRPAVSTQRFPRRTRLLDKADFNRAFKKARLVVRQSPFLLLGVQNELGEARLGAVVPKRQLPRAVDRNLIKRLCREQFRLTRQQLPPLDIVVLCQGKSKGKGKGNEKLPCPLNKKILNQKLIQLFNQLTHQYNASANKAQ